MTPPMRRTAADLVIAVVAGLLVFAAIPTVLVLLVGDPLGGGLGHAGGHAARLAMLLLAAVAWVAWTACCAQLARDVTALVRRGSAGVPVDATWNERLAARMAAGILALGTLGGPCALSGTAGAARPVVSHVTPAASPARAPGADRDLGPVCVVSCGATLATIAAEHLGDAGDWVSIAALNLGQKMAGSAVFVDPSRVRAGWALALPPGAAGSSDGRRPRSGPTARPDPLPELAVLGLGALGCAALTRRTRQRQRGTPHRVARAIAERSELAVDTDVMLARFAGVPALAAFEQATSVFGAARAEQHLGVRAICVGPDGVDFWLAGPAEPPAVGSIDVLDGGRVWRVPHGAGGPGADLEPALRVVLPVGEDDAGTWLVPVEPGSSLALLGPEAEGLWRAARAVQLSWTWSEGVLVTDDAAVAHDALAPYARRARPDRDAVPAVLFCGEASALAPGVRALAAVVSPLPSDATDVTVLVDRRAATIHPLARSVRPHLLGPAAAGALDELSAPLPPAVVEEAAPAGPAAEGGAHVLEPGAVEVRLLTANPRLEGLREELAPGRARRAVELVAYLALHHPHGVTSDRLRTRVLGSADADAASKTLFNTAAAARRSLGPDAAGRPLLPPGTRTGLYRVSSEVSVDVLRAAALVAHAGEAERPDVSMAYLRAALDLVEGEPLANALAGYTWWEAEGHGARIAAVLVRAACDLAALAIAAGRFELAEWGLGRARLVDPYSEALTRASMEVAAAAGDADRLRREWRDCQRRTDEFDPGASPSRRTESLYGELRRRVLATTAGPEGS